MLTTTRSLTQTLTTLLSSLVRMPTLTADQATNRAALDWVEEQIRHLPLTIERPVHQGYPSLIATTHRTHNPRLWLVGHIDVVQGAASTFKPVVRNGRLYGRGTHDMKSGIAVFIALLQELGPHLPEYDLGLMITADEELGGYDGVHWLIEEKGYRGKAALIPDSGGSWEMEMGAKGLMWWELTATGQSAHASRPWDGLNAIDQIILFVNQIRSHLKHEPCSDPSHRHTTLNLATLKAETATNQVPDAATARLDLRVTPDIGLETVTSWFEQAQAEIPSVKAKTLVTTPPYRVKDTEPIKLFRTLSRSIAQQEIKPTISHGSSDARHFAARGIPTITVSPAGSGFHVPHEWIDLADLERFYCVVREFVEQWAKR